MNMLIDEKFIVMLHGFTQISVDEQEHCDYDDPAADGWNVWVRKNHDEPHENGEPFSSVYFFDKDFDCLDNAAAYAEEVQKALKDVTGTETPLDMY